MKPITSIAKKPETIENKTHDTVSGVSSTDGLGSKELLSESEFSELKLQLYAPNLQLSLRMMMIAYARADYQ